MAVHDPAAIAANVASVRARIARAAERAGREPCDVTLVAVTKMVDADAVHALLAAGVRDIGENRASELKIKQSALSELAAQSTWDGAGAVPEGAIRWHFVGHLQRNKVKDVAGSVALIHSLDSERLIAAIDARAARLGFVQDVLVQVNLGGDPGKHGLDAQGAEALCKAAAVHENVQVRGIMLMGPLVEPETLRPLFRAARRLFDHLLERGYPRTRIDTLSMGMSNDFEVAVEEGATCVRVGTALFAPTGR